MTDLSRQITARRDGLFTGHGGRIVALAFLVGLVPATGDFLYHCLTQRQGEWLPFIVGELASHEFFVRLFTLLGFTFFGLVCARLLESERKARQELADSLSFTQQLMDTIPLPMFHKDENLVYTGCNKSFQEFLGLEAKDIIGKKVFDLYPEHMARRYDEMDRALMENPGVQVYEFDMGLEEGEPKRVIFHKATFLKADGKPGGIIAVLIDITEQRRLEAERERLIEELQEALDKVKVLRGFLPICASCKKIRDDKGYWRQIEHYIREHSDAEFSHGLCPECAQRLYPSADGPSGGQSGNAEGLARQWSA